MKKFLFILAATFIASNSNAVPIDTETNCLAKNIYHEARGEPWQGKMAVAITTINRTKHWQFPKTICKVVYQPGQFQWTVDRTLRIHDQLAWQDSIFIAYLAQQLWYEYAKHFPALYFHNHTVKPLWRRKRIATIGSHVFYQ